MPASRNLIIGQSERSHSANNSLGQRGFCDSGSALPVPEHLASSRGSQLLRSLITFKEKEAMSTYDRIMQLAREGNALALGILKQCYDWVLKHERDQMFAAHWVLGGIPVINLRTLRARGILEQVGSSRGGHRAYYRMIDPDAVGRALRALGLI